MTENTFNNLRNHLGASTTSSVIIVVYRKTKCFHTCDLNGAGGDLSAIVLNLALIYKLKFINPQVMCIPNHGLGSVLFTDQLLQLTHLPCHKKLTLFKVTNSYIPADFSYIQNIDYHNLVLAYHLIYQNLNMWFEDDQ